MTHLVIASIENAFIKPFFIESGDGSFTIENITSNNSKDKLTFLRTFFLSAMI